MDESQNKKVQLRFFQSAQSRVFLAIMLIAVAVAAVALFIHWRRQVDANQAFAAVSGSPGIASIPGAGDPSSAYVKAQTQANIAGATEAKKAGTAFIPTITRAGFVGDPNQFGQQPEDAQSKQCGVNKIVLMYKPNPANCTAKSLQVARQTGVSAEELLCHGCACPALKLAGYSAGDLKKVGMTAEQLHSCGFNLQELVDAGFSAGDLRKAGYSAAELKNAGFTAGELRSAGFSAAELKNAGYSAAQLKNAGYSAAELKSAGFSASDLKNAGFSAGELKDAGFTSSELSKAGYTPAEIAAAEAGVGRSGACDAEKLAKERASGVSAATLKAQGCGLEALKAAGFTAAQLKEAGFSAAALKNAGFSNADLLAAGFSPEVIKAADEASAACDVEKLKQERAAGISATALRARGCGLSALKAAGFSAGSLRAAGFSAADLKAAGFSAKDLKDAGFSAAELKKAGFSAAALKDAGFSAGELKAAGFSAAQLKDAGFSASDLKNAGFSPAQLKDAGFSAAELKNAGFSAADLKNAGFSAGQLASAGFSAKELKDAGFSAAQLKNAGFSAAELKNAGYSAAALKAAGYTNGDLLRSGFDPAESGYHAPVQQVAEEEKPVPGAHLLSINANTPEGRLAEFEKKQQEDMSEQQRRDQINRLEAYMTEMSQKLLTGWSNVTTQELQKAPEEKKEQAGVAAAGGLPGSATAAGAAGAPGDAGPIIKAGTVLFAVIDTSINSDENTPILGRVVAGPLNGSKLLGTFTRQDKRLLIQFNTLSSPFYPKTIALNAVAIDPDTARTALSGQVNSHYLLRYGSLFASSFLQGISEGIMNQGTVRSATCIIGCTTTPSPLNTNQVGFVGLGKVGQAYAQHMGENFTLPPTIRISAGTGIGVLVMADLTLPAHPLPQSHHAMGMLDPSEY